MTTHRLEPLDFADDESYQLTQALVDCLTAERDDSRAKINRLTAIGAPFPPTVERLREAVLAIGEVTDSWENEGNQGAAWQLRYPRLHAALHALTMIDVEPITEDQ